MRKRQHKKNIKKKFGVILKGGSTSTEVYMTKDDVNGDGELVPVMAFDNSRGKRVASLTFPAGLNGTKCFHDGGDFVQNMR